jgi:hypothetical protein
MMAACIKAGGLPVTCVTPGRALPFTTHSRDNAPRGDANHSSGLFPERHLGSADCGEVSQSKEFVVGNERLAWSPSWKLLRVVLGVVLAAGVTLLPAAGQEPAANAVGAAGLYAPVRLEGRTLFEVSGAGTETAAAR